MVCYQNFGKEYSRTLKFTFRDNFGLDAADIEEHWVHGSLTGFRSWYILQHYDRYKGKYKPFKVYVELEYDFNGTMEKGADE